MRTSYQRQANRGIGVEKAESFAIVLKIGLLLDGEKK